MMQVLSRELSDLSENCACELSDLFLGLSNLAAGAGIEKITQQQVS